MPPAPRSVAAMTQDERWAFVRREAGDGWGGPSVYRWLFIPTFPVATLRRLAWGQFTDAELAANYARLRRSYEVQACDDRFGADNPNTTLAKMIAWWRRREAAYPLVLTRDVNGLLESWDGAHRFHHFHATGSRLTLPVLLGVRPRDLTHGLPDMEKIASVTVVHLGTVCDLYRAAYANGRVALELRERATGEPWIKATVNVPGAALAPGEVFIKNYSENEGLLDALVAAKVVEPTGREVDLGHCAAPVCKLLV